MLLKRLINLKIKNIIALKNIVLINEKEREKEKERRETSHKCIYPIYIKIYITNI